MTKIEGTPYPTGMHFSVDMFGSAPAYNGSHGSIDGVNPGTRETVVVGYNYRTEIPRKVYGMVLSLAALTVNTDVKIRVALASRDGQFWRGAAGVSSGLPSALLASDTAGAALSACRSAVLGSTSARILAKQFTSPVVIQPGSYWLLMMCQCVYAADTANSSSFCIMSDNINYYPHEKGGATGNSRGIAYATVQTTDIDSLTWSSFISSLAANWVSASASSFAPTGRTWTGAMAAWNWGVLCEAL